MSNFLRKIKEKKITEGTAGDEEKNVGGAFGDDGPQPIDIDIYQTDFEFVLIGQMPGVGSDSLEISLEGDNDIVVIKAIPSSSVDVDSLSFGGLDDSKSKKKDKAKKVAEECSWNNYFRRIPLSKEIKPDNIDAKIKRGILILRLPFSTTKRKEGKKIIQAKEEE